MNEDIPQWDDLHLFLVVTREGGLSPAARITGRSPATLGRRMLALERQLGRDLFTRHERGYTPTAEARRLADDLSAIEARILRLTAPVAADPRPLVKLSAGTWTSLALLTQLDALAGTPPDIRLRLLSDERTADIARREATIGFRNQRPTDDTLAARKLAPVEFAPFGTPDAPARFIMVMAHTPSARWLRTQTDTDAWLEVSAPRNSLDLALAGKGIALLPTFIGAAQSGLVQRGAVIPDLSHDQWLVTHQDDRHLPEVRRTLDRIVALLARRTP